MIRPRTKNGKITIVEMNIETDPTKRRKRGRQITVGRMNYETELAVRTRVINTQTHTHT